MIDIRPASLSDINRILEIEIQSFNSDAFSKRQFISLLRNNNVFFLVSETNQLISGYIILMKRKKSRKLRIYSIAVDPSYRRSNIGNELIKKAFLVAMKNNLRFLSLEVNQQNKSAINFYIKHGFSIVKEIPNYYRDGEHGYRMIRDLY